jgi:hypothetical protein
VACYPTQNILFSGRIEVCGVLKRLGTIQKNDAIVHTY